MSRQDTVGGRVSLTRDELLVLLIEECGEVIQAATKCLRFGFDVDHGTGYGNNRDALAKEMGELTAVRDELELDYGTCQKPFENGWRNKIERAEQAKFKFGRAALKTAGGE
jgi:NTP pyrophosphatase (non-canonical NTP hydrolase)